MTDPAFSLPPEPDAYQRLLDAIHKARAHAIATDSPFNISGSTNTQAVGHLRDLCRLQLKALESGLFPPTEPPAKPEDVELVERGEPEPQARECCDTPAYCSSVRRCTASDTPPPSAEPVAWVAADTLNSPHPTCVSSLAYMSQLDKDRGREYVPLYAAPVAAQVPEGLTARDRRVLRFALHRFMGEAYARHNEASQKTTAGLYASGAAERFYRDAKDAERLLSVFAAAPEPGEGE